jgi:hypothetical protein
MLRVGRKSETLKSTGEHMKPGAKVVPQSKKQPHLQGVTLLSGVIHTENKRQ